MEGYELTVNDLIEYLNKNFKPTDKICFWDEPGAYMNCEYIPKSFLGERMFRYVGDVKSDILKSSKNTTKEELDEDYSNVTDDTVLMY